METATKEKQFTQYETLIVGDLTVQEAEIAKALPSAPTREQIERLESEMLNLEQQPISTVHHFSDGIYAREITIPAGVLLTGKIHKTEHLNIVSKGEITVWTEDGMKRVKAPFTMVSRPGTKRVGYAHTETVWTTIHATNETDLEKLEAELIEPPLLEFKEI